MTKSVMSGSGQPQRLLKVGLAACDFFVLIMKATELSTTPKFSLPTGIEASLYSLLSIQCTR